MARALFLGSNGMLVGLIATLGGCATQASPPPRVVPLHHGPAYPADALRAGIGGSATIDCTITRQGLTADCVIVRASNPSFGATALDFVRHARYSPATHDGVPIDQHHHIWTINYVAEPRPAPAAGP